MPSTSRARKSPWRKHSACAAAAVSTRASAPFETSSRIICCRSSRCSRWTARRGATASAIDAARVALLRAVRPLRASEVVRGQYRGYRTEDGVAADSRVETYVAARLAIENPRWTGVPFLIRTGKSLAATVTEVHVRFKPPASRALSIHRAAGRRQRDRLSVESGCLHRIDRPNEGARRSDDRRRRPSD